MRRVLLGNADQRRQAPAVADPALFDIIGARIAVDVDRLVGLAVGRRAHAESGEAKARSLHGRALHEIGVGRNGVAGRCCPRCGFGGDRLEVPLQRFGGNLVLLRYTERVFQADLAMGGRTDITTLGG